MKKSIALILALVLCLALCACGEEGGSKVNEDGTHDTFKIGVIQAKIDDESALISGYYQDYVGPHYNCEFVFSEACTTTDQCMTAIENFADAGCDAILSFASTDALQQCLVCQEKGMYFATNANRTPVTEELFTTNPDNYAGTYGADQPDTGKLFSTWMNDYLTLGEGDGFLVCTGLAYRGNTQQSEISSNILTAIQDAYGLTYETDIDTLVASSSPIEATNDKNIPIYLYPGFTEDGWLQGLSAALQTGRYNYLLSSVQVYAQAAVVISEVEASYNRNIVVGSFGTIGDSLKASFETKDQFGNPSIDMATVKPSSLVASLAFAEVYNCLTGHGDVMNNSKGEKTDYVFRMWKAVTPEDYNIVAGWDKDADTYIANYDVIDSMLVEKNPNLTAQGIQDALNAVTYEAVLERLG